MESLEMLFCSKWHLLQVSSRQAWRAQYLLSYQEWVGTRTLDTWQYVKFRSPSTWCSCISPGHEVRHNKRLVFVWFPGKKTRPNTAHFGWLPTSFPQQNHQLLISMPPPHALIAALKLITSSWRVFTFRSHRRYRSPVCCSLPQWGFNYTIL